MNPLPADRSAPAMMLAGVACFVLNDVLVKLAAQSMPMAQLLCLRGLLASVFLLALGVATRVPLRLGALTDRRVVVRALVDALATFAYVASIASLALADATAINMATPLIVTVIGATVLGHRIGLARWITIVAGFAGVLLIVQPAGGNFSVWSLAMLASATLTACRDLLTPSVSRDIPVLQMTLVATASVTLLSAAWAATQTWQPLTAPQLLLMAGAAACQSVAHLLMTTAFRRGVMSTLAPLRYWSLLFSAALGYALWGTVPNALAALGMVVVVGAGLRLMRR